MIESETVFMGLLGVTTATTGIVDISTTALTLHKPEATRHTATPFSVCSFTFIVVIHNVLPMARAFTGI